MEKNKRRTKRLEVHCGPLCAFCRDPDWFKEDEDDSEFGPDEWGYGTDGEVVIFDE